MKKSKLIFLGAVYAVTLFTMGCMTMQKISRVKPKEISPFLEHPELLVKQEATFPFHYFYMKENAGKYNSVYIAPVNTQYLRKNKNWALLDQKMAESIGSDIDKLAKFTQSAFRQEFARSYGPKSLQVVNSPKGNKTLIVELAIVHIVPTKAELTILGTAANIFLPGIGVISGKLAAGSVTIECMIRDAQTREIIAMYANTEKDQHAILNLAGMTWYTSAENNIRKQADYTARVFSGYDYSFVYRRLVKIIEF